MLTSISPEAGSTQVQEEVYPPARYSWYVVGLLTLAYIFSFIDRQILSLLVGPIQRDLAVSDKQVSLLMGLTFAVFYTFFGIPLGRLADVWSRRWLVTLGIAFWSLMTAGCGLTRTFWQLALARMGVGVGEASLSPAAYSLIADYFPPARRSTALGVYGMGIYIGSGLALIVGGLVVKFTAAQQDLVLPLVGTVRSWQLVFFAVGLPGLLIAPLLLTIREPTRKGLRAKAANIGTAAKPSAPAREVWSYVCENRGTFLCLYIGCGLAALRAYGEMAWIPSFFMRRHDWSPGETGVIFGLIVGVCGTAGMLAAGRLADALRSKGYDDADQRVAMLSLIGWLPFGVLYPLIPSGGWAAVMVAPAIFLGVMPFGLAPAAIQQLMPNVMRGQASAFYLFVVALIGLGLGPTVIATLTEDVFHNKNSIHLSLLTTGVVAQLLAAALLWRGLKYFQRSLAYLKHWSQSRG